MANHKILLVAFGDQENLGVGYLAAVLMQHGFDVEILDFRRGNEAILQRVLETKPLIVGLSIIFQYYTPAFAQLIRFLRANGVQATICAGGHYPSLRSEDALRAMPGLDCIVRFEGEYTLLELAQHLAAGRDWHDLPSLAYLSSGAIATTPLRPLIGDLDTLPFPVRWGQPVQCLAIPIASMVASRGCPRACSFCSIRRFYEIPPGPLRRLRSPGQVVEEMRELHDQIGARIFIFQDDDFALMSRRDKEWAREFVNCLDRQGLSGRIMWKINCRSDEVEPELFGELKQAGLFVAYLGIESGNSEGLRILNKQITLDRNRSAVKMLKHLGIPYEFGFMLFDPSSTFERVLDNIRFLRDLCGDGSSPIPFCKMRPYAGTEIEEQLLREGRLRGDVRHPDYPFLDPRLADWFVYLHDIFELWSIEPDSLHGQLRGVRSEICVAERFFPHIEGLGEYRARIKELVAWYNDAYCQVVEQSAPFFASPDEQDEEELEPLSRWASLQRRRIAEQLAEERAAFIAKIIHASEPAFA